MKTLLWIFSFPDMAYSNDLKIWTDGSGQTVQTQVRLLLEQQSDLGRTCLYNCSHLLQELLFDRTFLFKS